MRLIILFAILLSFQVSAKGFSGGFSGGSARPAASASVSRPASTSFGSFKTATPSPASVPVTTSKTYTNMNNTASNQAAVSQFNNNTTKTTVAGSMPVTAPVTTPSTTYANAHPPAPVVNNYYGDRRTNNGNSYSGTDVALAAGAGYLIGGANHPATQTVYVDRSNQQVPVQAESVSQDTAPYQYSAAPAQYDSDRTVPEKKSNTHWAMWIILTLSIIAVVWMIVLYNSSTASKPTSNFKVK